MRKKIIILFLLVCMFVNAFGYRRFYAQDDEVIDEISETVSEEQTVEEKNNETIMTEEEDDGEIPPEEDEEVVEPVEGIVEDEEPVEQEGFVLPDGFVENKYSIEGKNNLHLEGVRTVSDLVEGEDYKEKELIFISESLEYAQQVAEIYHATLVSYENNLAVLRASDDYSVESIVEACFDSESKLPLVEPNYIIKADPVIKNVKSDRSDKSYSNSVSFTPYEWKDWIDYGFNNIDPAILNTQSSDYQYYHDIVNTYAAWNATLGEGILVAVVDSSVDPDHYDLEGRIEDCYNVKPTYYGDGHGTHVAGIIGAAVNNGFGGAGIAPNARILGINIFEYDSNENRDYAETSSIYQGIKAAISHNADIINMSFCSYEYSSLVDSAIQEAYNAGIIMVAAAGNDSSNIKCYPACYKHVISVGATTAGGERAEYSNYGPHITISAPGTDIYSTINDDNYKLMSGTSMAAPVVSGALALYMSKVGRISYDEVLKVLKQSVNKSSSPQMGYGVIDLEMMFKKINETPVIEVYDSHDNIINDYRNPLPKGSYIKFGFPKGVQGSDTIIYSDNGKNPSIKNSELVNGKVYENELSSRIYVDDYMKGQTVKISAAIVNSLGVMGNIKTISIKTPAVETKPLKVKTVTLNSTKINLNYRNRYIFDSESLSATLMYTDNTPLSLNDVDHRWTSSNPAVAVVDEYGNITPLSAGTSKITLNILDGSKKTATCNVTVNQLVQDIEISGLSAMIPGANTTYKAVAYPSNAKNKKVIWWIENDECGATINAKTGKVTVPKSATVGQKFKVCAMTEDGSYVVRSQTVTIVNKATAISIDTDDYRAVYNNKGVLNSITLLTVDIDDSYHPQKDNMFLLDATIIGNNTSAVYTSSNNKVAYVDNSGYVYAVAPGKTTITAKTNDGSNKSASMTVIVNNPISGLKADLNTASLSEGKSIKLNNKVSYGDGYGKPTVKKVKWSIYDAEYYDWNYDSYPLSFLEVEMLKKYITINNSGVLTVKNDAINKVCPYASGINITIMGESQDGTHYQVFNDLSINRSIKVFVADWDNGYVYCDQPVFLNAKSSNPDMIGFTMVNPAPLYYDYGLWVYEFTYSIPDPSISRAKAKITIQATDGSNKTLSHNYEWRYGWLY